MKQGTNDACGAKTSNKQDGRIPANRGELLTNPLNPDPDFRLAIRMKSGLG